MTTKNLRTATVRNRIGGHSPAKADRMPRPPKEPDTSTYNGRVAKRIRDVRNSRGMSMVDFMARLADNEVTVNRSLVYDWENGSKLIHPNNYPAIAAALGFKTVRAFLPVE